MNLRGRYLGNILYFVNLFRCSMSKVRVLVVVCDSWMSDSRHFVT
jgi:hypothetical protein